MEKSIKPFLRWAGGKTWLTKDIDQYIPTKFSGYIEPFLGGGSIFFYLKNRNNIKKKVVLSDINAGLIQSYKVLRDNPALLEKELKRYTNNQETYYEEREKKYEDPIKEASRFIFLNRTSFNGIYRENLEGKYNVPYGYKTYKNLFEYENLYNLSKLLKNVELTVCNYTETMLKAKKNDLIFIDPPYTVAHENNGFVKYNQKIFSWEDQVMLKDTILELDKKGVFYILTNAHHESIIELYDGIGNSTKHERYSVVGGTNAKRDKYHEIIISNVNIKQNH